MNPGEPKILLDCDVFIHFLKGGRIYELFKIFPGRFVMLDKVKKELLKRNSNQLAVAVVFATADVEEIAMPTDIEIVKEYCTRRTQGAVDNGNFPDLLVVDLAKSWHKSRFECSFFGRMCRCD